MSGWGKRTDRNEAGDVNLAANNVPYRFVSDFDESIGTGTQKRNVIATTQGYVRRHQFIDAHGGHRIKDEVLVATSRLLTGTPYITHMYTSGAASNTANVYVVFSEPVKHGTNPSDLTLVMTQGANTDTLTANSGNGLTDIINANNTLVFNATSIFSGRYKVLAQTIGNTSNFANLVSYNSGANTANLIVTGAMSNALGFFNL
jgi:hypothetical protein